MRTGCHSHLGRWPAALAVALAGFACAAPAADLRLGIIGTDTSHAVALSQIFNDPKSKDRVPGGRVIAAFKGGSADNAYSASRVEVFAAQIRTNSGVRLVDSIPALLDQVDAVLLLSVDGRPHLEQLRPVIAARKPVFVDKPMAASLADVVAMFRLAQDARVPMFSASSLRFASNTLAARAGAVGTITNAATASPCEIEPHHPDLFWYGVHGTESLFTVLGPGCVEVRRLTSATGKIEVQGRWRNGAKGVFREDPKYGGRAEGTKGAMTIGSFDGYAPLAREIMKFFQNGVSPVPVEETLEIFAFMTAADESKRLGGQPVNPAALLQATGWPPAR